MIHIVGVFHDVMSMGVAGANMKWPHGSHGFELSSNVISKFSGRLMIGQNDSLDVLLCFLAI